MTAFRGGPTLQRTAEAYSGSAQIPRLSIFLQVVNCRSLQTAGVNHSGHCRLGIAAFEGIAVQHCRLGIAGEAAECCHRI